MAPSEVFSMGANIFITETFSSNGTTDRKILERKGTRESISSGSISNSNHLRGSGLGRVRASHVITGNESESVSASDDTVDAASATGSYGSTHTVTSVSTCEDVLESLCDACPYCCDVCNEIKCRRCGYKRTLKFGKTISPGIRRCVSSWLFEASRQFTHCQIRRHNSATDCWIIAHGSVYDATSYLPHHPGSFEAVLKNAGRDCSRDFDFHSSNARNVIWSRLRIGEVIRCPGSKSSSICHIM